MINNKKQNQAGFTLVELSIVLVIIGLIVSGVLAGQALIEQAKIRGQLRQFEDLKTAIGAFQAKYNYLPGDLPNPNRFLGITNPTTAPDGDGLIEGSTLGAAAESSHAIYSLKVANLIADPANAPAAVVKPKMGGASIALNNAGSSFNYFVVGVPTVVTTNGSITSSSDTFVAASNGFTGQESYAIDSKIDDGLANSGTVLVNVAATADGNLSVVAGAVAGCTASATDYIVSDVGTAATASVRSCKLNIRTGF